MHKGKIYFPGQKGDSAKMLDLSKTPILEDPTGKKTLIIPEKASKASLDKDLVAAMKAYWKKIQL
ncbi:MAG: hypothetical protein HUK40_03965 [Desulfobacter sp.]|nr:hypothetical protein [Desulfobacter sp.]